MTDFRTIDIFYVVTALATASLCLSKVPYLLRPYQGSLPKQAWLIWSFIFLNFTVLFLLQTKPVYVYLDTLLGMNNITWLLAYIVTIYGITLLQTFAATLVQQKIPRFEHIGRTVVSLSLITLYLVYLRQSPESLQRDIISNGGEYTFVLVAHLWTAWSLVMPLRIFLNIAAKDEAARVRMMAFVSGVILGEFWLILRLWRVTMLYLQKEDVIAFPIAVGALLVGMVVVVFLAVFNNGIYEQASIKMSKQANQVLILLMENLVQHLKAIGGRVAVVSLPSNIQYTRPDLLLIQQVVYVADWSRLVETGEVTLTSNVTSMLHRKIRSMPSDPSTAIQYCCWISIWWWIQRKLHTAQEGFTKFFPIPRS